jgi:hypothetical protein
MWQRLGLERAHQLHDRRRMQIHDRVALSAALSRVACSLTEQARFPVPSPPALSLLGLGKPPPRKQIQKQGWVWLWLPGGRAHSLSVWRGATLCCLNPELRTVCG